MKLIRRFIKRAINDAVEEQLNETDFSGALRGIVNQRIDKLILERLKEHEQ